MIPAAAPLAVDEMVETLFDEVLLPPEGFEYHHHDKQLLWPVYGQDRWRLLMMNKKNGELTPFFLDGQFIRNLAKALHATQEALNNAVSDDIPEPVSKVVQ